jgi:hypothetical protein
MLTHNIQRKIIRSLALKKKLGFAELRPKGVESNAFTYHLNNLIKEGFVEKVDGGYELTAMGKMLGINSHLSPKEWLSQAHSVVFVLVEHPEKGWLVRQRQAQPMYGYLGFLHFEPVAEEATIDTAKQILINKVGIDANLEPKGFGYARFFKGNELQSFTSYTVLKAANFSGDITIQTETGHSFWASYDELESDKSLLPTMMPILDEIRSGAIFYRDFKFEV